MKSVYLVTLLLLSNFLYGLEISTSLNKSLEKAYYKADYAKGIDIISKIEIPTSIWYKNNGDFKHSKNLYMWKVIFMYKTNVKMNLILPEFIYYKSLGGNNDSEIMNEINSKMRNEYLNTFTKKFESMSISRQIDVESMENILSDIFHVNLDTISSKNYQDYRRFNNIKNISIDTDSFQISKIDQTYDAVLNYVKNFKYNGNNVQKISLALTTPFKTDELKVFAIISFIVINLEYDDILKNKDKDMFGWGTVIPSEILLYKKTVCRGYSNLFNDLCKFSNIKSGLILSSTHAYNWVLINGKYNVLDVTWLDSFVLQITSSNIKNNEFYPRSENLNEYLHILHHFPIDIEIGDLNKDYEYNYKIGYSTKYGVFKTEEEMTAHFNKIKIQNFRIIFSEYK